MASDKVLARIQAPNMTGAAGEVGETQRGILGIMKITKFLIIKLYI
jgi:hypothetical protein